MAPYARLFIVHLRIHKDKNSLVPHIQIEKQTEPYAEVYLIDVYTLIRRFGLHDVLVKFAFDKAIKGIRAEHQIDGVHIHVRSHLTQFAPYLSSTRNLPFIHTEHFGYYHLGIDLLPPKQKKSESKKIQRWMQDDRLKAIMPVSSQLGKTLVERFNAPAEKIHVIANVASDVFKFNPTIRKESDIQIVCVANWSGPKKPLLLIDAISALPTQIKSTIAITFIGIGEYIQEMKVQSLRKLSGLSVEFTGFIDKAKIAGHLQNASFLVHPTESENAPTVIAEALCCGTPVLSMRVNGIPEMVNEKNGLLIVPNNVLELQTAVLRMIELNEQFDREEISREAHKIYRAEAVGKAISEQVNKML